MGKNILSYKVDFFARFMYTDNNNGGVFMKYIDMHCDTLAPFAIDKTFSLYENKMQVDFQKMKKGDRLAQFFAVFFPPRSQFARQGIPETMTDYEFYKALVDGFYHEIARHSDIIAPAKNAREIEANMARGKMSGILTIEDGRMIEGDFDMIRKVYDDGVRAIALTWNFENCFGYPNSKEADIMNKGLKPFGIEAIKLMNELGILIDVSHLSDGGFYDVAKYSEKPFVATHSNARTKSPHQRNLTDDMIKVLGEKGGVTGLNFAPSFINPNMEPEFTPIEGIVAHTKHLANIGGIDCVGLGTDFDGIFGEQEVHNSAELPKLWDALAKAGFHESEIEKISHKNVLRVIKESMK